LDLSKHSSNQQQSIWEVHQTGCCCAMTSDTPSVSARSMHRHQT
jgi:hypothetical protein